MEFGELPAEILTPQPSQLIVLMNVDLKNNPAHNCIWENFAIDRRSDRLPLTFKVADSTHIFPKPKPKKAPPETLAQQGVQNPYARYILKANWFSKHVHALPAVVVLVFDLDWDNPSFNEKKLECASKVEILRHSLEGRNTKICVLLVQQSPPMPTDSIFAQRANELCQQCSLPLKSLFVLPMADNLHGYILRLEHAFYEMAGSYYQSQIKGVKDARDLVAKMNNLCLLTRYQIKLGFYNELRQDPHSSLRHYKQAYQHVTEAKIDNFNALDIKIVAGLLNFKISQICFANGTPIDAIRHFKKHADYFKEKATPNFEFEHFGWMAKQFGLFADLFRLAVQRGLAPVQTQHPGFYYQSAAEYATARRDQSLKFMKQHSDIGAQSANEQLSLILQRAKLRLENFKPQFCGLRPWHALLSDYPQVALALGRVQTQMENNNVVCEEKDALCFYQHNEYSVVDHSSAILRYLNMAILHYERYKCPRMRLLNMLRCGEQYMIVGDYEKALQMLDPVVWEYRLEKWFLLLKYASIFALKCAFMIANLKAYVSIALELCSPHLQLPDDKKLRVQENLLKILNGRAPDWFLIDDQDEDSNASFDREKLDKSRNLWDETLRHGCFFHLLMHNIYSFIELRLEFENQEVKADEIVNFSVQIRLNCPLAMKFSKLSVKFENPLYDQFCTIDCSGEENHSKNDRLFFEPGKIYNLNFKFAPCSDDVGKSIQVTSLTLEIGRLGSKTYGSLHWENFDRCRIYPLHPAFNAILKNEFDNKPCISSFRISPRDANLSLKFEHTPPIMIDEIYPISILIENLEKFPIKSVNVKISCITPEVHAGFKYENQTENRECLDSNIELIEPQSVHKLPISVYCNQVASRLQISCTVTYNISIESEHQPLQCNCSSNEILTFEVISPFVVISTNLFDFKGEFVDRLVAQEKCILSCDLKSVAHFPVKIESVEWRLAESLDQERNFEIEESYRKFTLEPENQVSLVTCITPNQWCKEGISIGQLIVKWRRISDLQNSKDFVETFIDLPSFHVEHCPIIVDIQTPAYSFVRKTFRTDYQISNLTENLIELNLSMESSDFFMFSGEKQVSNVRLLPKAVYFLTYVYLPLVAGQICLPKLKITSNLYANEILDRYAQRNVPTTIFVLVQPAHSRGHGRIIGGELSPISNAPWLAQLYFLHRKEEYFFCGGSLLDMGTYKGTGQSDIILTAAHCLIDQGHIHKLRKVFVRLGEALLHVITSKRYYVYRAIAHENYINISYGFDIALIKLCKPVSYEYLKIEPVRLANEGVNTGRKCKLAGFGMLAPSMLC